MAGLVKKTQIYVTDNQWTSLVRESWLKKVSVAEVIRSAIDEHLAETGSQTEGLESALRSSAGIWRSRKVESGIDYVNRTRQGWSKRANW
jgi:ferritin-like metal-binding protein YciE